MDASLKEFFMRTDPFKVLPTTELERLVARTQSQTFAKGETVYSEGEAPDSVWILRKGRVQIFKYSSQGRPLAIESIMPGDLFGTLCRLGGGGRQYPCTAVAAMESEVLRISDHDFWESYSHFPALVLGVCSLCSQRLSAVQGLSCRSQEPVEKRLAMLLLRLRDQNGGVIAFTKRELAEQSGTTVETAIRVMSRFKKKGWIASSRGKIQLKDSAALQHLIDDVS